MEGVPRVMIGPSTHDPAHGGRSWGTGFDIRNCQGAFSTCHRLEWESVLPLRTWPVDREGKPCVPTSSTHHVGRRKVPGSPCTSASCRLGRGHRAAQTSVLVATPHQPLYTGTAPALGW